MARIRTIKPEFWSDEKVATASREARLTFLGIISAMADDAGRCKGDPRLVRAAVYPLDEDMTAREVESHIEQLAAIGVLRPYTVAGERYIEIVNWGRHQKIDRPSASRCPEPPGPEARGDSQTPRRALDESSPKKASAAEPTTSPALVEPSSNPRRTLDAGEERSGEGVGVGEGEGSGEEAAPRVVLPREADSFLAQFYEPALTAKQRDRYRDIKRQLYDVLDPKHPGPKIRGGARVKARSVEHLADTLSAVMKDPPPDRDLAIVWLLKKLLDPPKGPSVTEAMKRAEEAERATEDQYFAEAKAASVQWATDHPAEYEPIRKAVDANYSNRGGSFAKAAKESELTQRCARAAGFPNFEEWLEQRQGGGRQLAAAGSGT